MVNGGRSIPGYTHSNHYFVCLFVFQHGLPGFKPELPDEEKETVKATGCFSWLKCFFTQVSCRSAEKYECKISSPQESRKLLVCVGELVRRGGLYSVIDSKYYHDYLLHGKLVFIAIAQFKFVNGFYFQNRKKKLILQ